MKMIANLDKIFQSCEKLSSQESFKFVGRGALAVLSVCVFASPSLAESYTAKVVAVHDGDSLSIVRGDLNGKSEKAILYGIDCPELGQEFGQEARSFTDRACYRKDVKIEEMSKDSKGRIVANVYLPDGSNLNQQLVERGLAWWSDKYAPKDASLKALHEAAKTNKRGLWALSTKPVPPWIFRNGEKSVGAQIRPK